MALTPKRKQAVDLLANEYPEAQTSGLITLKQIKALFDRLKDERDEGGVVIGYPLWLTIDQEYRTEKRGVYKLPLNEEVELKSEPKRSMVYYTEESFLQECREAGINI